jgi:hypothetical protein
LRRYCGIRRVCQVSRRGGMRCAFPPYVCWAYVTPSSPGARRRGAAVLQGRGYQFFGRNYQAACSTAPHLTRMKRKTLVLPAETEIIAVRNIGPVKEGALGIITDIVNTFNDSWRSRAGSVEKQLELHLQKRRPLFSAAAAWDGTCPRSSRLQQSTGLAQAVRSANISRF